MTEARSGLAATSTTTSSRSEHILSWLEHPDSEHPVRFSDGHGSWTRYSYAALAAGARRNAQRLRAAGIGSGDIVLLIGSNTPSFVMSLYGVLHAGATPSIVAPALPAELAARLENIIDTIAPAAVLAAAEHAPGLDGLLRPLGCRVLAEATGDAPMADSAPEPPEVALVQFSSGSTGVPRGVMIPWLALNAQVRAVQDYMSFTFDSRHVSWAPFYHDMGLVGCLLTPLATQAWSAYMPPQEFIGAPHRWLAAISQSGSSGSAIPSFALRHVLRKVSPAHLEGLDLSRWQKVVIGAERVDPDDLDAFYRLLSPAGLRHEALCPAYGLAEATLVVTGVRPDPEEVHTRRIDTGALTPGKPVAFASGDAPLATRLASCGLPFSGMGVEILDPDGRPLPEGTFGEIAVSGEWLAAGYAGKEFTSLGARHSTGDMGFTLEGELYVVGRAGDSIKVQGRWLFAENVQAIAAAASPKPQRTVALLGSLSGQNTAVVIVEDCTAEEASAVGRAVAAKLPGLRVTVLLVPHGTLRRTTSGKPRRRIMWQDLVAAGDSAAHRVWDSAVARA
jgi:acyl-CoA synthetase (AMP-forming)/AMP-acid ligase II